MRKFRRMPAERASELLNAALSLFSEKGFARTSVAEIAHRAGVTAGTVYRYFPSKDALLENLIQKGLGAPTAAALPTGMADVPASEALRQLLRMMAHRLSDPNVLALPSLILRELPTRPALAELYRENIITVLLPALSRLVAKGIQTGEFRETDPELAARSLMGGLASHIILSEMFGVRPEGGLSLDRLIENHIDIVFGGLEAKV